MNRKDVLAAYQDFSARTSENVRTLSLGALAIVWVFRPESVFALPRVLIFAGIAAVLALTADFLHSLSGAIIWSKFHRTKELSGIGMDVDFKAPLELNWPTLFFFYLKAVLVVVTYAFVLTHLVRVLKVQ